MTNTTFTQGNVAINNSGVVAFVAQLNADVNDDNFQDTGVYVDNGKRVTTVVRTGTLIPGLISPVKHTNWSFAVGGLNPAPFVHINNHGEVLTQVILENGDAYVLVASPHGG